MTKVNSIKNLLKQLHQLDKSQVQIEANQMMQKLNNDFYNYRKQANQLYLRFMDLSNQELQTIYRQCEDVQFNDDIKAYSQRLAEVYEAINTQFIRIKTNTPEMTLRWDWNSDTMKSVNFEKFINELDLQLTDIKHTLYEVFSICQEIDILMDIQKDAKQSYHCDLTAMLDEEAAKIHALKSRATKELNDAKTQKQLIETLL